MGKLLHTIEKKFCSDPAECPTLIIELLATLEKQQWSRKDIFGIRMAIEEAFMNAIKHGNCESPDKKVQVKFEFFEDRFRGVIVDEGEGFCLEDVPDPREGENTERCSGRGVMLIQSFVDEVSYNQCGNEVEMIKFRSPDPDSDK